MISVLKKLFIGKVTNEESLSYNPIQKRLLNIKSIWNNDHQDDSGIEKIVRLGLSTSQLFFPGIYIKYFAAKIGREYQDFFMDIYILLKVIYPIVILKFGLQDNVLLIYIMTYVLVETLIYIPTLIFASDLFSRPKSYKRSMLLLFFNYIEIVVAFGVLYTIGENMNKPFNHWFDPIYFSVISSNSIGFGDYYPVTLYGKVLASIQGLFFLTFVILFLNFFSTKIKSKGYFDNEEEE